MPEISKVVIEKTAVVDPQKTEVTSTTAPANEPSMAEYAALREAEMRGEKVEVKADASTPAAATEEPAAATEQKTEVLTVDETDPLTQVEEAHPAKKGIAKRMGELTAEREAEKAIAAIARAEADKARQEAEDARAELAKLKQESEAALALIPAVPKAEEDPLPDRDNFDDPDEYNLAIAQFAARQELRKANESAIAAQKARAETGKVEEEKKRLEVVNLQIAELHRGFNERVTTAKTDYADFDEKVTNNEKLVVRNDIFFNIEQAEMAPHILYHLANNPEEVAALNKMQPVAAAIRIGELQAELRVARKPKVSKAAEPVKPVGQRQSPDRKSPDEETAAEYADRVNKEMQAKSRSRQMSRH